MEYSEEVTLAFNRLRTATWDYADGSNGIRYLLAAEQRVYEAILKEMRPINA